MSVSIPWHDLASKYHSLYKAACGNISLDPKFNSIHWAHDVAILCEEIKYSTSMMRKYARAYKEENPAGSTPSSVNFHVAYYANNTIVRIQSCRDKLALMVWAYFCPFNPEKFNDIKDLDFMKILKRLKTPGIYSISSNQLEPFMMQLITLKSDDFKQITDYRHMKIHRREPRIEIHGVKPYQDWPYNLAVEDEQEIQRWEESIKDNQFEIHMPGELRKQCTYNGVLYERKKLSDRMWDYDDVDKLIESTSSSLVSAAAGCFKVLRRRSPFKMAKK